MNNDTHIFFEVCATLEGNERLTDKIHEAMLEYTASNPTGEHPPLEPYLAANGVWIRWASYAAALEQ